MTRPRSTEPPAFVTLEREFRAHLDQLIERFHEKKKLDLGSVCQALQGAIQRNQGIAAALRRESRRKAEEMLAEKQQEDAQRLPVAAITESEFRETNGVKP